MWEACSEKNLLKWWGSTSKCKRLQETQLWISIHSRPLHWRRSKHGLLENPRTKWISMGNSIRMWEFSRIRLPIDVTSHNGTLTIAFDDKSSYVYLFLLFAVHSFSDTVGLIYPQDVVAPNAPDARDVPTRWCLPTEKSTRNHN